MPIPALPLFKHRDTVVTPADQNQFVTQFENTMDTMSNDVIPALNLAITDINEKVITATTARDEAVTAKNIAVDAKNEAVTAVATLQEGAIDDTTIAPNKAFSNQHIENNYYDKTEVDTAISDATLDINALLDKPIPINTDNFVLQEAGGDLKKLSFVNLKSTLLGYFDTVYSRTASIFGIGQTWQNVTASRSAGVTYTNTTGKPIMVIVSAEESASRWAYLYVNDVAVSQNLQDSGTRIMLTVIVPTGATYKTDMQNIVNWHELR